MLNQKLIFESTAEEDISIAANKLTLLDSFRLIKKSWDSLSLEIIQNCFLKTNILKEKIDDETEFNNSPSLNSMEADFDPFINEKIFSCYDDIDELQSEINDKQDVEEEDGINPLNDNLIYNMSYSEALNCFKNLELWFLQNCPDKLDSLDIIQNEMIKTKKKVKKSLFDYFHRISRVCNE